MYNTSKIKSLQSLTATYLSQPHTIELGALKELLKFHEYQYYVASEPFISDFEYDQLYQQLIKIESSNKSLITKDSPSQRVGNSLNNSFDQ